MDFPISSLDYVAFTDARYRVLIRVNEIGTVYIIPYIVEYHIVKRFELAFHDVKITVTYHLFF